MAELIGRIELLEQQLEKEREKYDQLSEETDLLAMENERLKELLMSHGIDPTGAEKGVSSLHKNHSPDRIVIPEGDGRYPSEIGLKIENASGKMNALSVSYGSFDGNEINAIVSGGVDKILRIYDLEGNPRGQYEFSAPILAIDSYGSLISCSFMDGGHALIDLASIDSPEQSVQTYQTHTKYVIATGWSQDGKYLFTCSHDKSIGLFRVKRDPITSIARLEMMTQLRFNETPECACFAPISAVLPAFLQSQLITESEKDTFESEYPFLVIGLRGLPYLVYLSVQTMQSYRVSLNENDWDTHVSFTPLHLSLSHNSEYLAIATDKDMHFILLIGTNQRVQVLAGGHTCDSYGKPKLAWDYSDHYLFSNSQSDFLIHIYSLNNGREVSGIVNGVQVKNRLTGHMNQIRDIRSHPTKRQLISTSFDRTVIEWIPGGV